MTAMAELSTTEESMIESMPLKEAVAVSIYDSGTQVDCFTINTTPAKSGLAMTIAQLEHYKETTGKDFSMDGFNYIVTADKTLVITPMQDPIDALFDYDGLWGMGGLIWDWILDFF